MGGEGSCILEPLTAVGRYVACVVADTLESNLPGSLATAAILAIHCETSTGCLEKTAECEVVGNLSCQCEVNSQYNYIYICINII